MAKQRSRPIQSRYWWTTSNNDPSGQILSVRRSPSM
jgi:hypothetical protein